ncbi:hypothetical protein C3Y92_16845 [Solidesulfovibrio carbinolicus]|uniref:Uncharacterized protein n=1 Tax=Solidesulfovibrio carbinolicus TaxID=296842 RepID=A0A4P6HNK2_9BACT|nr:hypothetical protein C3Y92_16845 [Solidesulfovibrio carbinolicus]
MAAFYEALDFYGAFSKLLPPKDEERAQLSQFRVLVHDGVAAGARVWFADPHERATHQGRPLAETAERGSTHVWPAGDDVCPQNGQTGADILGAVLEYALERIKGELTFLRTFASWVQPAKQGAAR